MDMRPHYLDKLRRAWKDRDLVIFLGAGVSIPHGIPNWNNLVMELVLEETPRFETFWPNYRTALVDWLSKTFDFTPINLSGVFKYRIAEKRKRWSELDQRAYLDYVRKALYRKLVTPDAAHDTLQWVTDLILRSNAQHGVRAVVTANFDNLLEQRLKAARPDMPLAPVYNERRTGDPAAMRILHVHGYLPQDPHEIPDQDIVFAEDEYNALTYTMFHWAQVELVNLMRTSTILFIGFSLSDPNVRRLLDATRADGVQHFVIKKTYEVDGPDRNFAVQDINYRAMRNNQSEERKTDLQVEEAIDVALRQARKYDEEMLERLAVGVLWIKSYSEVQQVLDSISGA